VDEYTITREGALIGPDDFNLVSSLLSQGFEPVEEAYETDLPPEPEIHHYQAKLSNFGGSDRMEIISAKNDEDAVRQAYAFAVRGVVLLELKELDENYDTIEYGGPN
jgi:hypothetical protein